MSGMQSKCSHRLVLVALICGLFLGFSTVAQAAMQLTILAHSNYKAAFDELIKRYNVLQSNVVVQALYVSGDTNVKQKFLTMAAGGVTPDILWHFESAVFGSNDLTIPLEAYLAKDANKDRFLADFIGNVTQRYIYRGQLYGLPFGVNTSPMVLFNRNKIAEAGLSDPRDGWKWEELISSARRLTVDRDNDGKIDTWGFDTNAQYIVPWLLSNGTDMFSPDSLTWYPDTVRLVEALTQAAQLAQEHRVMPYPSVYWKGFSTEKSAMYAEGNYAYGWIQAGLPFETGVVNWPAVKTRKLHLGGYGLFLGKTGDSQRQDASWQFIRWLVEPAQQMSFVGITKQIPSTQTSLRYPAFRDWMKQNSIAATIMMEAAQYGVPQYVPLGYSDCLNLTFKWVGQAVNGSLAPQSAADGLKEAIKAYYSNVKVPII